MIHTMNPGEIAVFPLGKKARIACCDCDLVHFFKFTVVHDALQGQSLVLQGWRDEPSTRALRRRKRPTRETRHR